MHTFFSGSPNEHIMVKCVFQHREGGRDAALGSRLAVTCNITNTIFVWAE